MRVLALCLILQTSIAVASQKSNTQVTKILLKNANIVDVVNLTIRKEQSVLIEQNKIVRVAPSKKLSKSKNAVVIDLKNKYIVPGLIDAHVHHATDPDGWDQLNETKKRLSGLIKGGVTSVRDMGGDARALAYLKRQAEVGTILSPDIFFSVIIGGESFFSDPRTVSSAKGRKPGDTAWMRAVDLESDFDSIMLQAKGIGATGIKIYADVEADLVSSLAQHANQHDLKVWSHAYIGPSKPSQTVQAGVETISHATDLSAELVKDFKHWRRNSGKFDQQTLSKLLDANNYQQLLSLMKEKGTILDATMTVFEQRAEANEKSALMHKLSVEMTRLAFESGITIAAGTDAFSDLTKNELPKIHRELALFVSEVGMSPIQAIQTATLNSAKVIGIDQIVGSIEKGKTANLLIVNSDPSENIGNLSDIAHVIKNGKFIGLGNDPRLPFVNSRETGNLIFLSGQIGNLPSTMSLAGKSIEVQMKQAMDNIGAELATYNLDYSNLVKCTLMLADIDEWQKANGVYKKYFRKKLPARSAFATSGLALDAKVEVECIAEK
ncbi:MAG: amidohydrolase family protein [Kangiellaceae bacterium]|nr:amidohydrolase family protein [Kangiellaceae bacterium]MCW9017060.1 amidohydrolase family protein [Kangiellaceae bacterium]